MLWKSQRIEGESTLFVDRGDGPCARLLLPPSGPVTLQSPTLSGEYRLGEDFVLADDGRTLRLPADSHVPYWTESELFVPIHAPDAINAMHDRTRGVRFDENGLYHLHQPLASYAHPGWTGPVSAAPGGGSLPRMRACKDAEPFTLVTFGDSITEGANASTQMHWRPNRACWANQLAHRLSMQWNAATTHVHRGFGGKASHWGGENIQEVTDHTPNLVILGWGVNDAFAPRVAEEFAANLQMQIDLIRRSSEGCEFVLIAPMETNPGWWAYRQDVYDGYRQAIADLCGVGVVMADVTTPWRWMVERKGFESMTGNGINHPNDFGHRLYADVVWSAIQLGINRG